MEQDWKVFQSQTTCVADPRYSAMNHFWVIINLCLFILKEIAWNNCNVHHTTRSDSNDKKEDSLSVMFPSPSDVLGEQKSGSGQVRGLLFWVGSGINISGTSPLGVSGIFKVKFRIGWCRGWFGVCFSGSGRVRGSNFRGRPPRVLGFRGPKYIPTTTIGEILWLIKICSR